MGISFLDSCCVDRPTVGHFFLLLSLTLCHLALKSKQNCDKNNANAKAKNRRKNSNLLYKLIKNNKKKYRRDETRPTPTGALRMNAFPM